MSDYKCATYDNCAKRQFAAHKIFGQSMNHLHLSNQIFRASFKSNLDACIANLDRVITLEDEGIENAVYAFEIIKNCRAKNVLKCQAYSKQIQIEYAKQIQIERDMMHDLMLVKKKYQMALQSSNVGNENMKLYLDCIHEEPKWQ